MGARASSLYALESSAKHYGLTAVLHDTSPDEIERQRPAVDFVAHDADGLTVAIEHTLHEPYDGYAADTRLMYRRLEPVRQRLRPLIADDVVLDLSIKPGTSRRLRTDAIGDLSEWAVRALPSLGTPPNHGAEWIQPPKGPYVRLRKWPRDYLGPSIRFRLDVGRCANCHRSRPTYGEGASREASEARLCEGRPPRDDNHARDAIERLADDRPVRARRGDAWTDDERAAIARLRVRRRHRLRRRSALHQHLPRTRRMDRPIRPRDSTA